MGIGEPLDNFDNLIKAIKIIHEPKGINLGWRNFTVSTCGLVNKIPFLAKTIPQCNLAISLHAPNDEIRNKILPINSVFKIKELIDAIINYIKIVKHDITIQYTLIDKINDSCENAKELCKLLKKIDCHVILIEYNPVKEFCFKTSKNIFKFKQILENNKISVSLRQNKGRSIDAACGTMRSNYEKK
jgi:23S rRNA (adenine2503-C2)-methyltransferase